MDTLEKIWESIQLFMSGLLGGFERLVTSIFGSANARNIKKLEEKVEIIESLEPKYEAMSNEELVNQTMEFRKRLADGETTEDILVEAFAVCREGGKRFLNMRHYDVQMIGGMVLHSGAIAEMVTGEGKTLVATLPVYLNAISQKGVHVVTVNDYLARRDMEWMAPLYMGLGLTVGAIQSDMDVDQRQKAYAKDITYGTNNEFGFDYLRDNMRPAARGDDKFPKHRQQSQGKLHFAIIDEVDNILIDEARTPLIISGPAHQNPRRYAEADRVARQLKKETHFIVNEKDHNVTLTDEGVREAEKLAGVESFYTAGNMEWPHLIDNALKAHYLYKLDVNYVIKERRVIIVDEFTGRLMDGRQWSDGLHQAVESKENVPIKEETQTLATITLQNYFKLYEKICGMTGTAMTEANEFWKIYQLDVIAIPTNKVLERISHPDVIYASEKEKFTAVADEIERVVKWDIIIPENKKIPEIWCQIKSEDENSVTFVRSESKTKETMEMSEISSIERAGRPVLVGTVSIEKSERLSALLDRRGIKHKVLNAKHHKMEAEIVAQAGRRAAVTIATNMAGRGTDIILGGNPETMAWARLQDKYETRLDIPNEEWDALVAEIDEEEQMSVEGKKVLALGGLHVIGTERHDARRIDLQLRGRCGRQGDPGSSRFYLCLEDDLMRIFAGPFVQRILQNSLPKGEKIESRMVSRRIESAQKKLEERNFEIRKSLLEYDEVMDEQRKRIYSYRQQILDGANCRDLILEMIEEQIEENLDTFLARDYGQESFSIWAGNELNTTLDPKQFRGADFHTADRLAKEEAIRNLESDIISKIEENLPNDSDEDLADWNWGALTRYSNTTFGTNFRDHDLKNTGRDEVAELLIKSAVDATEKKDLTEGESFLKSDFGVRSAAGWLQHHFGIEISHDGWEALEPPEIKKIALDAANKKYDEKEAEYPVLTGMLHFSRKSSSGPRIDRDELVKWAESRFDSTFSIEDIKNKQREEIQSVLISKSQDYQVKAKATVATLQEKVQVMVDKGEVPLSKGNGAVGSLSEWLKDTLQYDLEVSEFKDLDSDGLLQKLTTVVDDFYQPEMRRMERVLLLEIVDSGWKDHLLAMDQLRSAVGQRGLAAIDPKVEYKREGMRMFEELWHSIGQQVTQLIFRMESLNEDFVSSTWVETSATHEDASSGSELAQQREETIDNSGGGGEDKRIEPIRNRGAKPKPNEPCHCGSGKKYKACCRRKDRAG